MSSCGGTRCSDFLSSLEMTKTDSSERRSYFESLAFVSRGRVDGPQCFNAIYVSFYLVMLSWVRISAFPKGFDRKI